MGSSAVYHSCVQMRAGIKKIAQSGLHSGYRSGCQQEDSLKLLVFSAEYLFLEGISHPSRSEGKFADISLHLGAQLSEAVPHLIIVCSNTCLLQPSKNLVKLALKQDMI